MPDVYIHNRTCLPLSLALSQVGPLYMENNVPPGQSMKRHVGSVHFTIQAKVYNGTKASEFSPNDNIWPILGIGFATLTIIGGGLAVAAGGATILASVTSAGVYGLGTTIGIPAWAATAAAIGTPVYTLGSIVGLGTSAKAILSAWDGKKVVDSMGWYMGFQTKHFYISGGPKKVQEVDGKWFFSTEDMGTMVPFYVSDEDIPH